jgi:hypothetical protein
MVELWACVGLACTDKNFLDKLKSDAPATVKEYGFRLCYFEEAYLESLLADEKIVDYMEKIYPLACRPPLVCSGHLKHALSPGYDRYKELSRSLFERSDEKP